MNGTYIQYKCPKCGQGGAHPPHLPAPKCHRCEYRVIMEPVLYAERAVSPVESVETDFIPHGLVPTDAEQRLITHAQAEYQRGYEAGYVACHNEEEVDVLRQRAEAAETALTANRAGREYVALSDKELSDPEYMRAYVEGCQESFADLLAARQAPDLDSLQRYVATPHDKRGMREEKLGAWVLLSDVQAEVERTMRGASDNLQQASTAQAEPAKESGCKRWCGKVICNTACILRNEGAVTGATDAGRERKALSIEEIACMGFDTFRVLQGKPTHKYSAEQIAQTIMQVVNGTWLPGGAPQVQAKIKDIIADAIATPAQVTPEDKP